MYFAKNLVYLRKSRGLSQAEAATVLDLRRTTYAHYENGDTTPNFEKLIEIARYFGVSLDDLLTKNMEIDGQLSQNTSMNVSENLTSKLTGKLTANAENEPKKGINPGSIPQPGDEREDVLWLLLKEFRAMRQDINKIGGSGVQGGS